MDMIECAVSWILFDSDREGSIVVTHWFLTFNVIV